MLRTGEASGAVEGVLEAASLSPALEAHGLPRDEETLVRRDVSATGKGRASVNGALVPLALLRELLEPCVEIHGQHDHKGLLEPESHLDLLDEHAGLSRVAGDVAERHRERARLEAELERLRRDRRELARRREMLEFQAKEIEAAGL